MNDILPESAGTWHYLESIVQDIVESYGYREIRLPLLEYTELFSRSIGEVTDIVEKEMYTFDDRNGESLTLRPEATAGMVRAGMTNGLLHNQRQKLWTAGPMFRYEKPQQGRYRQFHQIDVEALGYDGPDVDAELIVMSARMWRRLGIERIKLEINSLGVPESRSRHREALVEYSLRFKREFGPGTWVCGYANDMAAQKRSSRAVRWGSLLRQSNGWGGDLERGEGDVPVMSRRPFSHRHRSKAKCGA